MATVYRALQINTNREVALKVLHHQEATQQPQRFAIEARATSALSNPHTITVYDFGEAPDGTLYLAMELLEGQPLDGLLSHAGVLPWRRAATLAVQICASLAEAHEHGVVHRDLKPSNVFVCRGPQGGDLAKVLDFGIAKLRGGDGVTNLTGTGTVLGTPRYMAPEQAMGETIDGRTDMYALGVMLYELFTGRPPFNATLPISLMMQHCHDPVPPPERFRPELAGQLPAPLRALLLGLLAKEPPERPASAREVGDRLRAILAEPEQTPAPSPEPAPLSTARRALWLLLTLPLAWAVAALAQGWGASDGVALLLGGSARRGPTEGYALVALLAGGLWIVSAWLVVGWGRRHRTVWPEGVLVAAASLAVAGVALRTHALLAPWIRQLEAPLREAAPLAAGQADEVTRRLVELAHAQHAALSVALLAATALAGLLVLGWVLLAPRAEPAPTRRRAVAALLLAVPLPLLAELWLAPGALTTLGPWRWLAYGALGLCLGALLLRRAAQRRGEGTSPWPWLAAVVMVAAAGLLGCTRALAEAWEGLAGLPAEALAQAWRQHYASLGYGLGVLVGVGAVAALSVVVVHCSRRLLSLRSLGLALTAAGCVALLGWGSAQVLREAEVVGALLGTYYSAPALAEMEPIELNDGVGPPPYLDRRPSDLRVGRRALLARLGDERVHPWQGQRLTARLAGRRRCPGLLRRLAEDPLPRSPDDYEPARCLTPAEAEHYCRARGKRLPSPAEWRAALSELRPLRTRQLASALGMARGPWPEWTRSPQAQEGEGYVRVTSGAGVVALAPVAGSHMEPNVTFRCAVRLATTTPR